MQKSFLRRWLPTPYLSVTLLETGALAREAAKRHGLSGTATAALAECMTATAALAGWLKDENSLLAVTWDGNGAGGKIGVSSDGRLRLSGFCENNIAGGDLATFIGDSGTLTVVRDDGEGLPFVGMAPIAGDIAESFTEYLGSSEQRRAALKLWAGERTGGLLLELLPGAAEEEISRFEEYRERMREAAIPRHALFETPPLYHREIVFGCRCSREKAESAILSLGRKEAEAVLREEGTIAVHCRDCNTTYEFDGEAVSALFAGGRHEGR